MQFTTCLALVVAAAATTVNTAAGAAIVGGIDCDACKAVVGEAQKFVVKDGDELIAAMSKFCTHIPDMNVTECQAFVEQYGSKIVNELAADLDPTATCTAIHLCKSADKAALVQALHDAVFKGDPNGTVCTVCKDFFTALITVLTNPQDQAEILQVLETPICDAVGPLKGVCDDLINTYGAELLNFLAGKINGTTVCNDIDAC